MGRMNIEIKARYEDHEKARTILKKENASFSFKTQQIDTYYKVPKGRLKMRQYSGNSKDCLIFYDRENIKGPKMSNLALFETPNAKQLKEVLDSSLEKKVIVDKTRELWWIENTRIHLDEVNKLGKFIEFEIITDNKEEIQKSRKRANELIAVFEIKESDLIENSYSDMLLGVIHGSKRN